MKKLQRSFLVLLLLSVFGCSNIAREYSGYEEPRLQLSSVQMLPSDNFAARFKIGLRLENPSSKALSIIGASYKLNLQGFEVITGVSKDIPEVPAYESREFEVIAQASLLQSFKLLRELMDKPPQNIDYKFAIKLDSGGLWPSLRLQDGGKIDLGVAAP
ncbi:MAG: LEA type 2 family protein [Cellvibrionaceae bacterium]|nr:LEA type 2 family protein [Cellvibrionaceae bacterium]